ncbi:SDR family NAD(P)-dependent oxidoreductase [Aneurinibacillus sp. Ricciae_BoGa-3]|uniref:SDR family NAD(P)-dependent oxidoreductase n=1 Tax=Aneurinibacillus sp. Ricciae_BoGa-3 TaxID=3022697 RepID=UPI002341A584|nr:SDR family oxidoreductase [Aneurinibacillus sp. Ricciae_BoGa-3]WCK56448.1 SDR family NAD(P)-dependent oxidoreductase [Aneurinibacillus sp. Ricciae_BoGa-3]
MSKKLSGVHALVTGASSGLGYAMAEALLEAGATVALTSRGGSKLHEAVAAFKQKGYDAYGLSLDVRSEQSAQEAAQWVTKEWGKLDVLVNNAGIGMRTVNPRFLVEPQPFYKVKPEGFRDLIDTNVTGYFLVARAFAPLMIEQRKGRIINISMNYETMKRKGFVPYGPSRAATESLSFIMAEDLKEYGVAVNMLLPGGATVTGMIPDEIKQEIEKQFSLIDPRVMGEPIVFLASDTSEGITGERIVAIEFDKWLKERGLY